MSYLKNSTLKRAKKVITEKELIRLREFHNTLKSLQDEQFTGDKHSVRKYTYKEPLVIKLTDPASPQPL